MTKEEFERQYAEKSGLKVEQLQEYGLVAVSCDCEYENCKGWSMERDLGI